MILSVAGGGRPMKFINKLIYIVKNIAFKKNIPFAIIKSCDLEFSRESDIKIDGSIYCSPGCSIRVRKNGRLHIGKDCFFNNNCVLTSRQSIQIGDNVIFGPNVVIFDHDHDFCSSNMREKYISEPIIIEDNVWVGANSIILRGAHIKEGTVIGAGCIVKGTVDSNVVYYNKVTPCQKCIVRK